MTLVELALRVFGMRITNFGGPNSILETAMERSRLAVSRAVENSTSLVHNARSKRRDHHNVAALVRDRDLALCDAS